VRVTVKKVEVIKGRTLHVNSSVAVKVTLLKQGVRRMLMMLMMLRMITVKKHFCLRVRFIEVIWLPALQ